MTNYHTTVEKVRSAIELYDDPIVELTDEQVEMAGIEPAHVFINSRFAPNEMSEAEFELVERYLAGHNLIYSAIDQIRQVAEQRNTDMSSVSYTGNLDHTGILATSLGQLAAMNDPTNRLEQQSKPQASIDVAESRQFDRQHDRLRGERDYRW